MLSFKDVMLGLIADTLTKVWTNPKCRASRRRVILHVVVGLLGRLGMKTWRPTKLSNKDSWELEGFAEAVVSALCSET